MFTYLDPKIRKQLIATDKLVRVDSSGARVDPNVDAPASETCINILGPIPLPIDLDGAELEADWYAAVRSTELSQVEGLADRMREQGTQQLFSSLASFMAVNSVLVVGDPASSASPLVRVHSNCLTGDVFGSQRCECGPQLSSAMQQIAGDPQGGLLIYMAGHEGRGIGLWAKAATYILQDAGEDTYQANESLGLPADSRDFSEAAILIKYFLGSRPFRLLTNNPKKIQDLHEHGLSDITPVKHLVGVTEWNRRYLKAKRDWGHRLEQEDIAPGEEG